MADDIRFSGVTVNAPDALALAGFYAEITGGTARGTAHWAVADAPGGEIGFQQVADFRAPTWPDGDVPMQMHLDLLVDDLEATEARVLAAGATRFGPQPNAEHCLVFADPVGHPFCLSTWASGVAATRVYVDMVGDLFHAGHVELLRAARALGDHLTVGVLSDETVAAYKRRPVMTLAERAAVIGACRHVDEVVVDAPDRLTVEFLDEHDFALVVHGDDLDAEDVPDVYAAAADTGRLRLVPRVGGLSTTEVIDRVRSRAS
ncbi:VOC family protein [Nocardioides currus]|uniref:ethanolamine-phosphate cytidylyltransferase n=1 Tax=Nocardioides currus TaxID=2133958 RepID=A0A2R7YY63_9ACTN|nr:VOC family protein [Nocardioides currus]PUA80936.1 hypothetical protein C7S10_11090 [Nocardioides currus]